LRTRKSIAVKAFVMLAAIVLAGATIACGNPLSTAEETQTAVAGAATPQDTSTPGAANATPGVTTTGVPQASATASTPLSPPPASTPQALTPITSGATARTDCPEGFATFRDLRATFAACAPGWLEGVGFIDDLGGPSINLATPPNSQQPQIFVAIQTTPRGTFPDPSQVATICSVGLVPDQTSGEEIQLTIAGLSAVGCHVIGEPHAVDGPLEEIDVTAVLPGSDGQKMYLNVLATWRTQSGAAKPLIDQILSTISVGP
jgi:hypothetical protein